MGYESKIIIVRKGHLTNEDGMRYATKLAEFDLGKVYGLSDHIRNRPNTDCYYYADDGNTQITEDRYGERLKEIAVNDLAKMVETAMEYDDYYLYPILFATLKGFERLGEPRIVCLHYGY